jgi:hypothetical protein
MTQITEDYISFETAKLLKEKGFDERVRSYYISDNEVAGIAITKKFNSESIYLSAPTIQMAMKWLREVHNLHVDIDPSEGDWKPNVIELKDWSCVDDGSIPICDSYEEACEAAIKYCLENLI